VLRIDSLTLFINCKYEQGCLKLKKKSQFKYCIIMWSPNSRAKMASWGKYLTALLNVSYNVRLSLRDWTFYLPTVRNAILYLPTVRNTVLYLPTVRSTVMYLPTVRNAITYLRTVRNAMMYLRTVRNVIMYLRYSAGPFSRMHQFWILVLVYLCVWETF
jgi:hypothetical protein